MASTTPSGHTVAFHELDSTLSQYSWTLTKPSYDSSFDEDTNKNFLSDQGGSSHNVHDEAHIRAPFNSRFTQRGLSCAKGRVCVARNCLGQREEIT